MKKLFYSAAIIVCSVFMVSCEREDTGSLNTPSNTPQQQAYAKNNDINLKVSEQGYLIFENEQNVDDYISFLATNNLDYIKNVLDSYNFHPLYSNNIDKDKNPEFLVFNESGIVQIGGNLFKLSTDRFYLTTMNLSQLSIDNYISFTNDSFNPQIMNKFSLFKDRGGVNINILDKVNANPSGINEQNDPPASTMAKFWGIKKFPQPCNPATGQRWVNVVRYVLWQEVWETGYFEPC